MQQSPRSARVIHKVDQRGALAAGDQGQLMEVRTTGRRRDRRQQPLTQRREGQNLHAQSGLIRIVIADVDNIRVSSASHPPMIAAAADHTGDELPPSSSH